MLYGENLDLLFTDLAEAHRELDEIVLRLYGLNKDATEAEMVGRLFEMIKGEKYICTIQKHILSLQRT